MAGIHINLLVKIYSDKYIYNIYKDVFNDKSGFLF